MLIAHLSEENPEAVLFDGLQDALVGIARRCGQPALAVYDRNKCIRIFVERDGMTPEEADEFFSFNTECTWAGPMTPLILDTMEIDDGREP